MPPSRRISALTRPEVPAHLFPEAGRFAIYSNPKFLVRRGDREELVDFRAEMEVRLSEPEIAETGRRRVRVEVDRWDAIGRSKLLDGELRYSLIENVESYVDGGSAAADLPGRMVVGGKFSLSLNEKEVDRHDGRAVGLISSFPPAPGDLFDISGSRVSLGDVQVSGVLCACAALEL
jgi:hypothetical protein